MLSSSSSGKEPPAHNWEDLGGAVLRVVARKKVLTKTRIEPQSFCPQPVTVISELLHPICTEYVTVANAFFSFI